MCVFRNQSNETVLRDVLFRDPTDMIRSDILVGHRSCWANHSTLMDFVVRLYDDHGAAAHHAVWTCCCWDRALYRVLFLKSLQ